MEKKLYRSTTNKMLAGLCGGFAEYSNVDATVIRVIVALVSLGSVGLGLIIYLILACIVPTQPE